MAANVFNKFSIATTGAAFIILGTISMAPAKATSLTKVDYSGTVNVSIVSPIKQNFDPVAVNESYTVDNLSGRLSDAGDSELTIDNPLSYLKAFTDLLTPYNASLSSLNGSGSVFQDGTFLSSFNFFYDKPSDILTVKDYDVNSIQPCLSGTCQVSGNGNFSGTVYGFIPASGNLNFDLTQTATPLPDANAGAQPTTSPPEANADAQSTTSLPEANANAAPTTFLALSKTLSPTAKPVSNSKPVPEPSAVLGFIGLSGLFAAQRKLQKHA